MYLKIVFFVCDDINEFALMIKNQINIIMKEYKNFEFEILIYNDYNKDFFKKAKDVIDYKVFVFDIEMPSMNGIECARKIRQYDEKSYVLFVTSYYEKHNVEINNALVGHLLYINKNEYKNQISHAIQYISTRLDQKNSFRYAFNNVNHRIDLDSLKYIHYEKIERKSTFYDLNINKCNLQLCEIYEHLDERYRYSHRSCIVNIEQIKDIKKNEIIFKDNTKTDYLSRTYRKALIRA